MSVFSSLRYCIQDNPHNYTNLYWALGFVPLGLFFDFMDGKVARWRKKASLMGQELDSLADLVRPIRISGAPQPGYAKPQNPISNNTPGLLRCRPCRRSLLPRPPYPRRPHPAHLLRPLRPHPSRALQRHRRHGSQRRDRQIPILRRHTHPHVSDQRADHGVLGVQGLDARADSAWLMDGRLCACVPSRCVYVCAAWVFDG
jgi:hypothetical protein